MDLHYLCACENEEAKHISKCTHITTTSTRIRRKTKCKVGNRAKQLWQLEFIVEFEIVGGKVLVVAAFEKFACFCV